MARAAAFGFAGYMAFFFVCLFASLFYFVVLLLGMECRALALSFFPDPFTKTLSLDTGLVAFLLWCFTGPGTWQRAGARPLVTVGRAHDLPVPG